MVSLISPSLFMLLAQAAARSFPLTSQWAASISGENHDSKIQGTFVWDSMEKKVPEVSRFSGWPRVEARWKFDSWFAAQGLDDALEFTCSFSDEHACTSRFRKQCNRGLIRSRTETLVKLLAALNENGTHDGECSAHSDYSNINATDAQVWAVKQEGIGNLSMCITSHGFPLALVSIPDKDYVGSSNVIGATFRFLFHNVTLGPQSILEPICPVCPVAPCPGEGVISMEVARMTHGNGEPWDQIWNLDTSDVVGEITLDHEFGSPYLKVFNVTVNSSWGPMRDCNFLNGENHISPPRDPSFAKLVARWGAEELEHPCDGQCTNNELGSWYAFPKEGGCPRGVPIGTDGCTWRVNSVKVVSTDCVKSAGRYGDAYHSQDNGHAPWPHMQDAVRRGIAGCSDIRSLRR
eukprot:TRINITY_DN1395_c0_g1_i2.p1 TRINITY_DN1395_c0_g1~~TRINITY_DN1395_c0_g1_i2.p1  ORF type:complete len:428 (-),score=25.80 TRINITY_DN1395_c0_g1_i2:440-1657(-)